MLPQGKVFFNNKLMTAKKNKKKLKFSRFLKNTADLDFYL